MLSQSFMRRTLCFLGGTDTPEREREREEKEKGGREGDPETALIFLGDTTGTKNSIKGFISFQKESPLRLTARSRCACGVDHPIPTEWLVAPRLWRTADAFNAYDTKQRSGWASLCHWRSEVRSRDAPLGALLVTSIMHHLSWTQGKTTGHGFIWPVCPFCI